jgi:hypothetical protein
MLKLSSLTVVALVACGPRFGGTELEPGDVVAGAGGELAQAGASSAGRGGSAGAAGAPAAAGSGGTAGDAVLAAGVGGEAAGDAGAPAAARGGADGIGGAAGASAGAAAAGSPAGAAGVSGGGAGGAPSCAISDAINPSAVPEGFQWDGFSSDNGSGSCAWSSGGGCTFEIWEFPATTERTEFIADISCDAVIIGGACGAEGDCGALLPARFDIRLGVIPESGGYRTTIPDRSAMPLRAGDCSLTASRTEESAEYTLWYAAAAVFDGALWRCP